MWPSALCNGVFAFRCIDDTDRFHVVEWVWGPGTLPAAGVGCPMLCVIGGCLDSGLLTVSGAGCPAPWVVEWTLKFGSVNGTRCKVSVARRTCCVIGVMKSIRCTLQIKLSCEACGPLRRACTLLLSQMSVSKRTNEYVQMLLQTIVGRTLTFVSMRI